MNRPVILCAGGDARFVYTSEGLCSLGKVYSFGQEGYAGGSVMLGSLDIMLQKADMLVLPMLSGVGLDIAVSGGKSISCAELSGQLNKNALVVGGRLNTEIVEYFSSLGHDVIDYFVREELVVRNCIPTAEGALLIAMQELAVTIQGTRTLVIGFGRVAKASAKAFSALGSSVSVAARRLSQLAQAENENYEAFYLGSLKEKADKFDVVINTVPALILTKDILERLQKDCLVIDLASKPGGTDFEAARQLNVRAVHALALPGKTAPKTSGEIIADAIKNIYYERRETNVFKGH